MNPFDHNPRGRFHGVTLIGLASLLLLVPVWLIASPAAGAGQPTVKVAKVSQAGRSLIVQIRTVRRIALKKLNRQPDFTAPGARYLCFEIGRAGHGVISRICLGGKEDSHHKLGVSRTSKAGKVYSTDTIPARVKRVARRKLVATFRPGAARLVPGPYRWRVALAEGVCDQTEPGSGCVTTFPEKHRLAYRVLEVRAAGCTGGNGQVVLHGPRSRKRVALTFDDGPGPYTPQVLRTLRRFKVKATFFMLGMQVNLYPSYARSVARAGHEIANHSSVHALLPGYSDIRSATHAIKRRTGFRTCLFRPPYGAMSSSLKSSVRRAKMKSVIWDVDTNDWKQPGSGSIQAAITGGVKPGSIVLMHDAGGPRSQTVAALPGAIRNLRKRGYRFVTVSRLLGNRVIYRPVR